MSRDRIAPVQGLRDIRNWGGITQLWGDLGIEQGGVDAFALVTLPGATAVSPALVDGQLSATTTAAPLEAVGSGHAVAAVYAQADPANTAAVTVTDALGTAYALTAGQGQWLPALVTSQVSAVAASGTQKVNWTAPSATGGTTTGLTTTAAQVVGTTTACAEVVVMVPTTNPQNVLVGGVDNQFVALTPGSTFRYRVSDASLVYVKAAATGSGITVYWQSRVKA